MNIYKKIVDVIWPIKANELKKFVPMSLMLLLTIYVYCALRGTKDTILIPVLGAEMISTVKLYGVLPSAIIFMVIYTKLTNILQRKQVFYSLLSFFILFFASYAYYFHPNQANLHLDFSSLKESVPFMKYPLIMLENWTIALFYIMAELWGSIMLSLMFWQFANYITKVNEAKRYYSLFGLWGQLGMIAAGLMSKYIADFGRINDTLSEGEVWSYTLKLLVNTVIVAGGLLAITYWWINQYVLTDKRFFDGEEAGNKPKKKKVKLSVADSFKYIFTSKYLGLIAALVISYGISINLVEGVWKSAIQQQFPIRNDYLSFMGGFQTYTALATMIGMVIGVNVIRRVSWFAGAILTPLTILVTGGLFFIFFIYKDSLDPMVAAFSTTALFMAVFLGATQNILSKAIKYSAFDATKEMAYIPLDEELKTKGKAAVDVVGARLGKSGGAVIQWLLLSATGLTIPELSLELFIVFLLIMGFWCYSVLALSKRFESETSTDKEQVV